MLDGSRTPVGFAACGDSNGAVMATTKTDLKTLDCYRASNDKFCILDAPPMQYPVVDGHGDLHERQRQGAVELDPDDHGS